MIGCPDVFYEEPKQSSDDSEFTHHCTDIGITVPL
jgi:hypothetical protein